MPSSLGERNSNTKHFSCCRSGAWKICESMTLPSILEKEFQSQVMKLANALGWLQYHTYNSRRSVAGFPDLVLVKAPRVIFAELKTDKGKVSDAQKLWLMELGECSGVETYLWRPAALDEIAEILNR